MPAPLYFTAEMVRARLLTRIAGYLASGPVGEMFASPADISWAEDVLVQPDLFVVRRDEANTLDWAIPRP